MPDDDLCDDLDVLLADDLPGVLDPDALWPPDPLRIWPPPFPVAAVVRPACQCPVVY